MAFRAQENPNRSIRNISKIWGPLSQLGYYTSYKDIWLYVYCPSFFKSENQFTTWSSYSLLIHCVIIMQVWCCYSILSCKMGANNHKNQVIRFSHKTLSLIKKNCTTLNGFFFLNHLKTYIFRFIELISILASF